MNVSRCKPAIELHKILKPTGFTNHNTSGTYVAHEPQIVIVDDGSTNDSKDIILDYAARHPTISAYFNGVNQGVMTSLKRAMDAVSCDYVVVIAADDLLLSDFIAHNLKVLEKHPSAGLSFSELVSLDGDTGVIDRFATNPRVRNIFDLSHLPEYLSPEALREKMKRRYLPIPPNTAVIRFDLLQSFGGFPPELSSVHRYVHFAQPSPCAMAHVSSRSHSP